MGLHTGEPWLVEQDYVGMDVHRAARICHVGNGDQVLLSETTTALVQDELPEGVTLLDLGRHFQPPAFCLYVLRRLVAEAGAVRCELCDAIGYSATKIFLRSSIRV